MTAPNISQLAQNIQRKANDLQSSHHNESLRQDLIRETRTLLHQLETPRERLARMTYYDFSLYPVTRVLVDLGVFRILDATSQPTSVKLLAEKSGADPVLLERLLKLVAAADFVEETGADEYAANDTTRTLASPGGEGIIMDLWQVSKVYDSFPQYFEQTGYTNPSHKDKSAWYNLYGQHYFEYIFAPGREKATKAFHDHMKFKAFGMKWYEVPGMVEDVFESKPDLSENQAVLLDIGGSTGHDLLAFAFAQPQLKGRKILQDLPSCIDALDKDSLAANGVEAMSHNFFTPQPIVNAKAYYLKMVLHDWPNEQCRQILSNIRPAMKPGYSSILLNEFVIPEMGAEWQVTSLDILMMAVHGAQERREREWRELVEQVEGLRVKKIWVVEGGAEQIIEIERVE